MFLINDSTGRVIGFTEMTHVSTAPLASVGETVVATIRPDGHVAGYVMHSDIQMSDTGLRRLDSASLKRMGESATHTSRRAVLDAAGQRKVRELASWLAERCHG